MYVYAGREVPGSGATYPPVADVAQDSSFERMIQHFAADLIIGILSLSGLHAVGRYKLLSKATKAIESSCSKDFYIRLVKNLQLKNSWTFYAEELRAISVSSANDVVTVGFYYDELAKRGLLPPLQGQLIHALQDLIKTFFSDVSISHGIAKLWNTYECSNLRDDSFLDFALVICDFEECCHLGCPCKPTLVKILVMLTVEIYSLGACASAHDGAIELAP